MDKGVMTYSFLILRKLIEGCGKIGEVEKALSFYLRMRERGDPIDGPTYIGVFVSCSRCQDKDRGVEVADQVWALLKSDGFHFSCKPTIRQKTLAFVYTNYMKVYAACGNDVKVLEVNTCISFHWRIMRVGA